MVKSPAAIGQKLTAFGMADKPLDTLPTTLRRAVTLMLWGAAGTVVWGILVASSVAVYRDGIDAAGRRVTASGGQTVTGIVFYVLVMVVLTAAWVLMARKNQEGRGWARITSSVLFLAWSLWTWITIGTTLRAVLPILIMVVTLAIWAIGAVALFLIWRPGSTTYYKEIHGA
jgi:hypothetical protein